MKKVVIRNHHKIHTFLKQILIQSTVSQIIYTSALLKNKWYRFNGSKIISMASAATQYIRYKFNAHSNV
jgi:hypothetical protein